MPFSSVLIFILFIYIVLSCVYTRHFFVASQGRYWTSSRRKWSSMNGESGLTRTSRAGSRASSSTFRSSSLSECSTSLVLLPARRSVSAPRYRPFVPTAITSGWPHVTQGPKFKIPRSFVPRPTEYTCQVSSISAQRSRHLRVLKILTPRGCTDDYLTGFTSHLARDN